MTKSEPRGFGLLFFPPQKMCFYLNTMYFFLTNLKDHLYYMPDSHVNWVYFHVLYSISLIIHLLYVKVLATVKDLLTIRS